MNHAQAVRARPFFLSLLMQGYQPCCVEAAVTAAIEYYYWKKTGTYVPLSFRFLAALTASKDGINYATGGTSLAVALQVAQELGVCTADTFPNDIEISPTEFVQLGLVPQKAYDEALQYKIPGSRLLTDVSWDALNAQIAANKLVITSLFLDKDWYLSKVPNSNPLPLPPPLGPSDPSKSGHATLSYGFDGQYRYLRNSFGPTFGQDGNGWYGRDYQPYVYAAAVIVDPIFQAIGDQVAQVATAVDKLTPADPDEGKEEGLIGQVIGKIEEEIGLVV